MLTIVRSQEWIKLLTSLGLIYNRSQFTKFKFNFYQYVYNTSNSQLMAASCDFQ